MLSANEAQSTGENGDSDECFVDITFLIEECAASLTYSNPTLHNEESFSLHDTMAALELMDPKMDCCELSAALIHEKNDASVIIPPRPIPQGLNDPTSPLPWDDLSDVDGELICLEILTRLESLLGGASVAESTYTCLYAHAAVLQDMKQQLQPSTTTTETLVQRLDQLKVSDCSAGEGTTAQWIVYAATLGLVEISDVVRSIVLHADIYEEEDFSVNTFGLSVLTGGPETIAILEKVLVRLKAETCNEEASRIPYLILSYQLNFLRTCSTMAKLSAGPARQVTAEAKQMVKEGAEHLQQLQVILEERPPQESKNSLLTKCFDPYIYRPLVGSSPVRKVAFHTPMESVPILQRVLAEIDWAVCDLLLLGETLMQIRRLLNRISVSSVNILSRSLIVLNLYFDDKLLGQHVLSDLIGQQITQMTGMPEMLLDSKYGKAFLNRLAKPMYDTLKLFVLNRNRQQTYMEAIMFHDWSSLQQEAHVVDMQHRQEIMDVPPYFTQYTLYLTVWLMDHHVALGIELQLFTGQHDLAVAYWYRDFLLSSLLNTLTSIRATKKLSLEKNYHGRQPQKRSDEDEQDDLEFKVVGFKRTLCRGIVRYIASLNQAEMVHVEQYEFTSHEKRFEKRFEPFQLIAQPPALSYDDFQSGSDFSNVSQSDLLASTSDCFKKGKAMLEKVASHRAVDFPPFLPEDIRALTKVCVGNSVFVMKLTQLVRETGTTKGKVIFDFDTDSQYCTIKL